MKNIVYLVQQGIVSNQVVSGKSGKNYGTAIYDPNRKGVVLRMSMEEYQQAKDDLIGSTAPNQQWVPDIVPEVEKSGTYRGKCCIPDGCPLEAEFIWDRFLYCRGHAPNNATPIDASIEPLVVQPTPPPPAAAEKVEPEKSADDPPVAMQPVIGTEDEGRPADEIPPQMRRKPAVQDLAQAKEAVTGESVTHLGTRIEFTDYGLIVGKTKMSIGMLESLGNGEPDPKIWFRIAKRDEDGVLTLESKVISEDQPQSEKQVKDLPFRDLQKLAKNLGINTYQMKRATIVAAIEKKQASSEP